MAGALTPVGSPHELAEPAGDLVVPAYRRLASEIRARIVSGQYAAGCLVPSEQQLAGEFGLSRGTVRRGLADLEQEGLLVASVGRGRRVAGEQASALPAARYEALAAELRAHLGEEGGEVPGEIRLAHRHGVSRGTARRALAELEREGLVRSVPGRGRFVVGRGGPKFEEARERIREHLMEQCQPGERIPSELALAELLGVSRETVRHALVQLQEEGLVSVSPRRGRFLLAAPSAVAGRPSGHR